MLGLLLLAVHIIVDGDRNVRGLIRKFTDDTNVGEK